MTAGLIIGGILGLIFAFTVLESIFQKGMKRAPDLETNEAGYNIFELVWGILILVVFVVGGLTVGWITLDCMWDEPTTLEQRVTLTFERWGDIIEAIGGMLE